MTDLRDVTEKLEALYTHVEKERMKGIPIINPRLKVKAVGIQEWGGYWFGVMLTPWFMNLLLLPKDESQCDWKGEPVGSKIFKQFPAGRFEFIVSHETALGRFLMSSLFSPVLEFGDQETAEMTAETVVSEVFKKPNDDELDPREQEMEQIWKGEKPSSEEVKPEHQERDVGTSRDELSEQAPEALSRRDLIKGQKKSGERSAT